MECSLWRFKSNSHPLIHKNKTFFGIRSIYVASDVILKNVEWDW